MQFASIMQSRMIDADCMINADCMITHWGGGRGIQ
jgi:hypothetical protein